MDNGQWTMDNGKWKIKKVWNKIINKQVIVNCHLSTVNYITMDNGKLIMENGKLKKYGKKY